MPNTHFWLSRQREKSFIHLILFEKDQLAKCAFDTWIFKRKKKKKSGDSILGCSKQSFGKVLVGSNTLQLSSCISEYKAALAFCKLPVWPGDWQHTNKSLKTRSSTLMSGVRSKASQILHCPTSRTKEQSRWGDIRHSCSQPTHIHWALCVPGSVLGSGDTAMAQSRQPGAVDGIRQIKHHPPPSLCEHKSYSTSPKPTK